jgi:hypothetical protein
VQTGDWDTKLRPTPPPPDDQPPRSRLTQWLDRHAHPESRTFRHEDMETCVPA